MQLLEVKDLTVSYNSLLALDGVSLVVGDGEIVAVIGPNGAGKSTLLKAICGLLLPQCGDIRFKGQCILGERPYELAHRGLCLVPEGRRVFRSMTVMENLEMGAFTRASTATVAEDIEVIFHLFPALKELQGRRAGTLSSGEQQMLAVGRALMLKPSFLLLDEPSLGLSPNYVQTLFAQIKEVNKMGTTILLVEQNAKMALECSDRTYVFEISRIVAEGKSASLLRRNDIRMSFLGL